jgi:hypothetical protein
LCTPLCTGGFRPAFWSFLMVLPSPLHAVPGAGDMTCGLDLRCRWTFRVQRERRWVYLRLWRPIRRQRRCVGSRPSSVDQSYLSMAGRTHSRCLPLSTCSLVVPDTTWASSAAGGDCGGLPRVCLSTLVGARSPAACVDVRIRTGRRRFRSPGAFAGDRVFLGSDSGFDSRWVRWMGAFVLAESVQ